MFKSIYVQAKPINLIDMNIAYLKFCDRIYWLAQGQICYLCEESYARIQVLNINASLMFMSCRRERTHQINLRHI